MKMNQDEIKNIIPHRDPMLLVDTVEELTPGESIQTTWHIDPEREIFKGHFPGDPVLPGVYSVECMAQTADIMVMTCERYAGLTPLFLGIDKVSFLKKICPGDDLVINAQLTKEYTEKAILTCRAEILLGGSPAARAEITLAMR